MDGDGINDFAISAAGGAKVYMFRGRSDIDSRPSSLAPEMVTITHPSFTQTGEISGGLDVDGDGLKDLVIGDTNAVYVFRGDATHGVATSPISVFAMPAPTIATGFPVLLAPSLRDSLPGEQAFPDVVIGKVAGPVLSIRY